MSAIVTAVLPGVDRPNIALPSLPEAAVERGRFDSRGPLVISVAALAAIATTYALSVGVDIALPLAMAIVLSLLLRPTTTFLNVHARLPLPVAALVSLLASFAAIVAMAYALSLAAESWSQRLPESFAILKQKLAFLTEPISATQEALRRVENLDMDVTKPAAAAPAAPGNAIPELILFGTAAAIRQFFTTMLILFFMLASGDRLLRGVIEVLPRFADKRKAVEIAAEVQAGVANYLTTITLMNAAVGFVVAGAMWGVGLPTPLFWGAAAFLLNFIPIIGPLLGVALFFAAGVVALPWPLPALAPAALYLLIHLVEGQAVTPMLVSRRFELNPVLVILSLLFWHALWGMPGAFLAVPLLAILKIFCDRIDGLKNLGHLIGS